MERGSVVGEEGWEGSPEEVFWGFIVVGVVVFVLGLRRRERLYTGMKHCEEVVVLFSILWMVG